MTVRPLARRRSTFAPGGSGGDEAQSPLSMQKIGCEPQSITADQGATTYSCQATSAGGAAAEQTVSIKRDATPPTISGARSPLANVDGWTNKNVAVTWTCGDNLSEVASCSPGETLTSEGRDQSAAGAAKDNAGNTAADNVSGINIDKGAPNAPTVSPDRAPEYAGDGGWYKGSVTAAFASAGDPDLITGEPGSGVASSSVPADKVLTASGTASGTVTDRAGNESAAGSLAVQIDTTEPTVTPTCPSAPVLKGAAAAAKWTAVDGQSGLKTADSGTTALDTAAVGPHTVSIPAGTARDNVGNGSPATSCSYTVVYDFKGFFQPIDNTDAAGNYILNKAKAGSTIPVKFSLAGNQGTEILAGAPQVASAPCVASATDALEEYSTDTTSGLKYDAAADQYVYNWKTATTMVGTCRQLIVKLADGTSHRANFTFVK